MILMLNIGPVDKSQAADTRRKIKHTLSGEIKVLNDALCPRTNDTKIGFK